MRVREALSECEAGTLAVAVAVALALVVVVVVVVGGGGGSGRRVWAKCEDPSLHYVAWDE